MNSGSTLLDNPANGSNFGEPVVIETCAEPEGRIARFVMPMRLSQETLHRFYEKAKKHRVLFNDDIHGDFKKFCEIFISQEDDELKVHGLFWVVDDFVGVFYMTHIHEHEALVHFTFLDGRLKGRLELTRSMLRYVFNRYGFKRLNVEIGYYAARYVFHFVEQLGFKREGRKRKAVLYSDEWFDLAMYGILREDVLGHVNQDT